MTKEPSRKLDFFDRWGIKDNSLASETIIELLIFTDDRGKCDFSGLSAKPFDEVYNFLCQVEPRKPAPVAPIAPPGRRAKIYVE